MYTNLPTLQGYIFRILQHFATKLCSFSNFDNFFPEIFFVIPRLKNFLKRKSSIATVIAQRDRVEGFLKAASDSHLMTHNHGGLEHLMTQLYTMEGQLGDNPNPPLSIFLVRENRSIPRKSLRLSVECCLTLVTSCVCCDFVCPLVKGEDSLRMVLALCPI